ncbi:MAG: hypothetical protein QOG01_79 [Pseudonocardiales bacterium]|jgi:hypothetical protein|nr:hypothetical protein [Pseudonocardiales bacterium]
MATWEYTELASSGYGKGYHAAGQARAEAVNEYYARLNEFGAQGWELVAETRTVELTKAEGNYVISSTLKRQVT